MSNSVWDPNLVFSLSRILTEEQEEEQEEEEEAAPSPDGRWPQTEEKRAAQEATMEPLFNG